MVCGAARHWNVELPGGRGARWWNVEVTAVSTGETGDRLAVEDLVGAGEVVVPDGGLGNAEGGVDGGGEVLGGLGVAGGVAAVFVGGADDGAAGDAAAGEEDGLHGAPVVAAGEFGAGDGGDFRGASEFAGHDDEGGIEETAVVKVVEEGRDRAVHRGEEEVLEVGEGGFVGVPGFVVAEVDLDEADAGFDELAGHEEGPAEGVAAVAIEGFGVGVGDVERGLGLGVGEEGDGHLAVAVKAFDLGGFFEELALGVEFAVEGEAVGEAVFGEAFGEGEVGGLEEEFVGEFAFAVVEVVFGKGAVAFGVVGGGFEEEGGALGAHEAGELPGDGAAGVVDDFVGELDDGGQVVARWKDGVGDGGDGGPVGVLGFARVEAGGHGGAPAEHGHVPLGVLVVGVGEGAAEGPEVAAFGEFGKVLADVEAGGLGRDGFEFAADFLGGVGLHVEALVLGEAAGEEDVDDGFGFRIASRRAGGGGGAEGGKVVDAEAKEADGAGLNGGAPGEARMGRGMRGRLHGLVTLGAGGKFKAQSLKLKAQRSKLKGRSSTFNV